MSTIPRPVKKVTKRYRPPEQLVADALRSLDPHDLPIVMRVTALADGAYDVRVVTVGRRSHFYRVAGNAAEPCPPILITGGAGNAVSAEHVTSRGESWDEWYTDGEPVTDAERCHALAHLCLLDVPTTEKGEPIFTMTYEWLEAHFRRSPSGLSEAAVWRALWHYADRETNQGHPSVEELSAWTGVTSRQTISTALKRLESYGALTRVRTAHAGGLGRYEYTLHPLGPQTPVPDSFGADADAVAAALADLRQTPRTR